MGIRLKTILSIMTAVICCVIVFSFVANRTLRSHFLEIEEKDATSHLSFLLYGFEHALDGLEHLTNSWATWDDACRFIQDGNQPFIESNLKLPTFSEANFLYIGFFSMTGQTVWQGYLSPETGHLTLPPPPLARVFTETIREAGDRKEAEIISGFAFSDGQLLFVSCNPVLKSDLSGPPRGWLIMAQPFSQSKLAEKLVSANVKITFSEVSKNSPPTNSEAKFVLLGEGEMFSCSAVIKDILNRPAIKINIIQTSHTIEAIKELLGLTRIGIAATGAILALVICLLMQKMVLGRLLNLRGQVTGIVNKPAKERYIALKGDDELSWLAFDISQVLRQLSEQERMNHHILKSLRLGILLVDNYTHRVEEVNPFFLDLLNRKREEIVKQPSFQWFTASEKAWSSIDGNDFFEHGILHAKHPVKVLRSVSSITYDDRTLRLETYTDMTEIEQAKRKIEKTEAHYQTIFMNSATPSAVFTRNGVITKSNTEFIRFTGASRESDVIGRSWTDFCPAGEIRNVIEYHRENLQAGNGISDDYESQFIDLKGNELIAKFNIAILPGTDEHVVSIVNMTEQKKSGELLKQQTLYDNLTGLPNRQLLSDRLEHAIAAAHRNRTGIGLLLMDLDGFKQINDTMGHVTGDKLLKHVAERLKKILRKSDTAARLGGDEFTFMVENLTNPNQLMLLVGRVREALRKPFELEGTRLHLTLSIGISYFPDDAPDSETMIRNADLAMYRAKRTGDAFSFFTEDLDREARNRFQIDQDLRKALEENQFHLAFQPKVELGTGRLVGAEGLVRWQHPDRGLIMPDQFIPVSEMNGLIIPMDLWVLEAGCRQITTWNETRKSPLVIATNLSAGHFRNDKLPDKVHEILERTGCSPSWLELEITETAFMENMQIARPILDRLRGMGISIALDDFGTGYSSLNYLKSMPFDTLKIDQSFIRHLETGDEKGHFMLETIVQLGRRFGMKVVAEGVEDQNHADMLHAIGCQYAQGYYYSRPLPADTFPIDLEYIQPQRPH